MSEIENCRLKIDRVFPVFVGFYGFWTAKFPDFWLSLFILCAAFVP